jgi:monoterpene epsilon-lactone hydrolase
MGWMPRPRSLVDFGGRRCLIGGVAATFLDHVWQSLMQAATMPMPSDPEQVRQAHAALWDSFGASNEGLRARCLPAGSPVPMWRVEPEGPSPVAGAVVSFHAGGWALGSARGEAALLVEVADLTGRTVFGVDYSLVPGACFPVQVGEAEAAIAAVCAEFGDVLVSGCSAGGQLALAGVLALRGSDPAAFAKVSGLRLMSPGTDLRPDAPAWREELATDWVKPVPLRASVEAYLAGADPENPLASPVLADLRGLPPVRMQACAEEALAIDNRAFVAALSAAGVPVGYEEVSGVPHAFHLLPGTVPAARDALRRLFA